MSRDVSEEKSSKPFRMRAAILSSKKTGTLHATAWTSRKTLKLWKTRKFPAQEDLWLSDTWVRLLSLIFRISREESSASYPKMLWVKKNINSSRLMISVISLVLKVQFSRQKQAKSPSRLQDLFFFPSPFRCFLTSSTDLRTRI